MLYDCAGGSILDALRLLAVGRLGAVEQRVAVVKPGADDATGLTHNLIFLYLSFHILVSYCVQVTEKIAKQKPSPTLRLSKIEYICYVLTCSLTCLRFHIVNFFFKCENIVFT